MRSQTVTCLEICCCFNRRIYFSIRCSAFICNFNTYFFLALLSRRKSEGLKLLKQKLFELKLSYFSSRNFFWRENNYMYEVMRSTPHCYLFNVQYIQTVLSSYECFLSQQLVRLNWQHSLANIVHSSSVLVDFDNLLCVWVVSSEVSHELNYHARLFHITDKF